MGELTTQILIEIRDEIRATRGDLNERLDRTNERLDQVVHEQIRHATAIVDLERGQRELAAGQRELAAGQRDVVVELRQLNARLDHVLTGPLGTAVRTGSERVEQHETRLSRVEQRLELIERERA